jgi:RND superfamily putative drug exporter
MHPDRVQQVHQLRVIAGLTAGEQHGQGPAAPVNGQVDLRAQSAAGATQRLTVRRGDGHPASGSPFLRAPALCWCARTIQDAADRIVTTYHIDANADPDIIVVTLPPGASVDSPAVHADLARIFGATSRLGMRSVDYPDTGDTHFLTADHRTAYGLAYLPPGGEVDGSLTGRVTGAVTSAAPAGYAVSVTGLGPLQDGGQDGGQAGGMGLLPETIIGAAGALVILAFVFGSFVAVLPVVMAGISILTAFLLLLVLTTVTNVNFIAEFIIGLIGLGVAIDYSLLVVTRWREERAGGAANRAAVERAMAHAGRAVAFSGVTVTIGLLALAVLPIRRPRPLRC